MPTTPEKPIGDHAQKFKDRATDALKEAKEKQAKYKDTLRCASVMFRGADKNKILGGASHFLDPDKKFEHAEQMALCTAVSSKIAIHQAKLKHNKQPPCAPAQEFAASFADVKKS